MWSTSRGTWVIVVTLMASLCLSAMPLAESFQMARPEWVALVLIYWIIALPHRVGILSAWILGIAMDLLHGHLLGYSGLVLVIIAFFAQHLYQRMRMYLIWQQSLVIFLLIGIGQFLKYLIEAVLVGYAPHNYMYLLPAVISALIWPLLYVILRALRRHYDVM